MCRNMPWESFASSSVGAFLFRDNQSLATFVRSHHSLHSLHSPALQRSALLCSLCYTRFACPLCFARFACLLCLLALFMGSLTDFAHSLVGQLKILNTCLHCKRVQREQTRFLSSLETRPIFTRSRFPVILMVVWPYLIADSIFGVHSLWYSVTSHYISHEDAHKTADQISLHDHMRVGGGDH